MNYINEFYSKFKPLLTSASYKPGQFHRWPAFEFIAEELFKKNRPLKIIETGCHRGENWLGYGHSTVLWDYIISKTGGEVYSCDIDSEAIKFARSKCEKVKFVNCDSIGFLRTCDAENLDFLYLDSYDWSREKHVSSCLHHMGELAAIYDRLPKGCLIAVDDAHSQTEGKHVLVHQFFDKILNQNPIVSCHTIVWRKN